MPKTAPIGFHWHPQRFFRSYYVKKNLNIYDVLMNSVREKTSALNEPICKEEKAEFLIAINFSLLVHNLVFAVSIIIYVPRFDNDN